MNIWLGIMAGIFTGFVAGFGVVWGVVLVIDGVQNRHASLALLGLAITSVSFCMVMGILTGILTERFL